MVGNMKSVDCKYCGWAAKIVIMVCFLLCSDITQSQQHVVPEQVAAKSEPPSFSDKIRLIDRRFDIWMVLLHPEFKDWDEQLDPKVRQAFNDAFATRTRARQDTHAKAAVLSLTEPRADSGRRALPQRLVELMTKDSPSLLEMDEDARRQFISEYYERVFEIETVFSEQVDQILSPSEQAKLLRGPVNVTSFLVHPIAAIYLNLTTAQKTELRRRYDLLESAQRARMSEIQSSSVTPPTGKTVKLLRLPTPDEAELTKYYETLAVLSQDQLKDFLRLQGKLNDLETLDHWFESLSEQHRKIAEPLLRQ